MRTVVVAITINKGGQGKTMLVKTLATAAVAAGYNVEILDVDSQQNSVGWRKRRDKNHKENPLPLPLALFCGEKNLLEEMERAEKAGCELILIDTPPGKSPEAMAAVDAAEFVIIPFTNDQDAYEGVATTTLMARRLGKKAVGLLNCVPPHSKSHEETAREVLKVIGLPMAPVVLSRYDVHRLANPKGLTAQEMEPGGGAALEIQKLWDWFCAHVQMGTNADVHDGSVPELQTGTDG